jgi:hypothetical protein
VLSFRPAIFNCDILAFDIANFTQALMHRQPSNPTCCGPFIPLALLILLREAIYLYTDGITEAANRTDEMFTEQRLEAILREASPFRPKDVIQAVADAVQSFANSVPQSDDITAMAIRLLAR